MIGGGAKTLTAFIKADMAEQLILDIEPQLFFPGMTLIDSKEPFSKNMRLISAKKMTRNIVRMTYR